MRATNIIDEWIMLHVRRQSRQTKIRVCGDVSTGLASTRGVTSCLRVRRLVTASFEYDSPYRDVPPRSMAASSLRLTGIVAGHPGSPHIVVDDMHARHCAMNNILLPNPATSNPPDADGTVYETLEFGRCARCCCAIE